MATRMQNGNSGKSSREHWCHEPQERAGADVKKHIAVARQVE